MKKIKFLLVAFIAFCLCFVTSGCALIDKIKGKTTTKETTTTETHHHHTGEDGIVEDMVYGNLQFHFLELGNEYTGDCTFIKAGDLDILIDAGSRKDSVDDIAKYVKQYCTDGKLEYVVATHAHQDHIAGFVGSTSATAKPEAKGIFRQFEVGTLIDFSKTDATSTLYQNYLSEVEYAVSQGTVHKQAADFFADGATNVIQLTNDITMTIIWNKYYFEKSSDENNYSVCTLFSINDNHFLLTGDLEKEGEEAIAEHYNGSTPALTLPHCRLFKAGHHGSPSSSNDCLLAKITPEICCVCCCAGATEYTNNADTIFPSQEFINRIAKYTDRVYVTTVLEFDGEEWTNASLNGNIIVSCNGTDVALKASNNLTKLKDSTWFNADIYYKIDSKGNRIITPQKGSDDFYDETTEGAIKGPRRTWPGKE